MDEEENDDEEDFRPLLHRRWTKNGYWEEYDGMTRTKSRICDKCTNKVCSSSTFHCALHEKKSSKRTNEHRSNTKRKKKPEMDISEQVRRKESFERCFSS